MSASRITLRLVTLLLLLAGILLLRKPLFSQTISVAPTRFSVVIQSVAPGVDQQVIFIPGLATSRAARYTTARAATPNLDLVRIDNSRHFIMYHQPAAFDRAVQAVLRP